MTPATAGGRGIGRRRLVRAVLLAVALLAVASVLALAIDIARDPAIWFARRGLALPYDARGRLVDVGGRRLYLDCRGAPHGPTLVLEAGMGSGAEMSNVVIDPLAGTTRTCAYDRAGLGRSDPPPGQRTIASVADDLATLLDRAGITGPIVIVGHSFGVDVARVFATRHRDRVAGLVFLDGFVPDLYATYELPLMGAYRQEYADGLASLEATVARVERLDWGASYAELVATQTSLVGLPIRVLDAMRYDDRLGRATNEAIVAAADAAYEGLSPGHVRRTLVPAGHLLPLTAPDAVVAATRELLATISP